VVSLGSQLSVIPLWGIVSNNKHLVSRFKAKGQQAKGQVFDVEIIVLPGIPLPDTITLMAHSHAAIAILFIVVFEYLRPGVTLFSVGLLHLGSYYPHVIVSSEPSLPAPVVLDLAIALSGANGR
jgi:hypothetical protein